MLVGFRGWRREGGGRTAGEDEDAVGEFDHGEGPGDVHEVYHVARSGEYGQHPGEAIEDEE